MYAIGHVSCCGGTFSTHRRSPSENSPRAAPSAQRRIAFLSRSISSTEQSVMGQCISIGANGPAKSRRRGTAATRAMASGTPMKVMIAGAPAAGKGTQCENIVRDYNLVHISVGDLLRAEVAAGTDAGKRAKGFMDAGALVPNEVVVDMVKNRLAEQDVVERGWLLDGYPRSGEQAEAIEEAGIRPDCFLLINVPDEVLVERVTGRRSDPETGAIYHLKFKPPPAEVVDRLVQRSDDTEEMVVPRLKTYHDNVNAVVVRSDGGAAAAAAADLEGVRSRFLHAQLAHAHARSRSFVRSPGVLQGRYCGGVYCTWPLAVRCSHALTLSLSLSLARVFDRWTGTGAWTTCTRPSKRRSGRTVQFECIRFNTTPRSGPSAARTADHRR